MGLPIAGGGVRAVGAAIIPFAGPTARAGRTGVTGRTGSAGDGGAGYGDTELGALGVAVEPLGTGTGSGDEAEALGVGDGGTEVGSRFRLPPAI